ncbi:hypothetical protein PSACC_01907 [Paramicrosporidium saccamoebae]|uniref:DUF3447 domain-containing protein n=1 Tax=Paramicrosporidium saccamoebae TaxID=1246581 RepID=A0A2H9TKK5_9FUNG|nr:hypothetical protein PSACC_01907 [Paramicrosporidium saccamoebae]
MNLSLVALFFISPNFVPASCSDGLTEEQLLVQNYSKAQALADFKVSLESAALLGNFDNIPAIPGRSSAERVLYYAMFRDTAWDIYPDLLSASDLEQNVHSILIADNPKILEFLPELLEQVLDSNNLANYDAINLTKTLSDLSMFEYSDIDPLFASLRVVNFLKECKLKIACTPFTAILTGNVEIIHSLIKEGLWVPKWHLLHYAINSKESECLMLFLQHAFNRGCH